MINSMNHFSSDNTRNGLACNAIGYFHTSAEEKYFIRHLRALRMQRDEIISVH